MIASARFTPCQVSRVGLAKMGGSWPKLGALTRLSVTKEPHKHFPWRCMGMSNRNKC